MNQMFSAWKCCSCSIPAAPSWEMMPDYLGCVRRFCEWISAAGYIPDPARRWTSLWGQGQSQMGVKLVPGQELEAGSQLQLESEVFRKVQCKRKEQVGRQRHRWAKKVVMTRRPLRYRHLLLPLLLLAGRLPLLAPEAPRMPPRRQSFLSSASYHQPASYPSALIAPRSCFQR